MSSHLDAQSPEPEAGGPLRELAHEYGVATDFTDWRGRHTEVPEKTVRAVLAAMDVDVDDPGGALRRRREEPLRRMLPPSVVATAGEERTFAVHVDHGAPVKVWVEPETGGGPVPAPQRDRRVDPREVDGRLVGEATFAVPPDLAVGYHRLHARSGETAAEAPLVVTPAWLGLPDALADDHAYGFAAQLYSVRSEWDSRRRHRMRDGSQLIGCRGSWGVGDLMDLEELMAWAGDLDADFLLVNPLHAAEPTAPMEPSPYLPTSRQFFNPLYLCVEMLGEYHVASDAVRLEVDRLGSLVQEATGDLDAIDRNTAWSAKRTALRLLFDHGIDAHGPADAAVRREALREYVAAQGDALHDFATWWVIASEHGPDYRTWPDELRDVGSPAVAAYRDAHAEDVEFACWLQWMLEGQLMYAQDRADSKGMRIGVMHDLAVGVHPGGADAWRLRTTYATGMRVGAPPDPFNQLGQDWSQPPWRPDRLAELGYAPWRELLRTVLRHAGGLRVDHVIGLFRLWWVPQGASPAEGTYVRYDHEAMVGVLALEAQRAGAVVVGEDLGVVEPSAREHLARRGILGTSILWWERDDQGRPLPAERWRELCLASVTTHDLPPTAGYLAGDHVDLRDRLGLLTRPVAEERAADREEQESWLAELRERGLLAAEAGADAGADAGAGADVDATVDALHAYLALTPSRLRCVALTDAVGDTRTQNQPGTVDEYPNWRVPLAGPDGRPLWLGDVLDSRRARAVAATLRGRPAPRP